MRGFFIFVSLSCLTGFSQDWNASIGFSQKTSDNFDRNSLKFSSTDNNYGAILELSRVFNTTFGIRWKLDLSLGTSRLSFDQRFNIVAVSDSDFIANPSTPVFIDGEIPVNIESQFQQNSMPASTGTTGFLEFEIDHEIYTLGIGISGAVRKNKFGLEFSLGPTITYSKFTSERTHSVNLPGGNIIFRNTESFGDKDYIFGYYSKLEVQYFVTDVLGVGLGYRYDFFNNEKAETELAEVDFEGTSLQLKLIYAF